LSKYIDEDGKIIPKISSKIIKTNNPGFEEEIDITLRITESCNLNCSYCMYWHEGGHYKTSDILTTMINLYKYLLEIKVKKVLIYFHGGEATTHPDIILILKKIRSLFNNSYMELYIEFNTNLILKEDLLKEILLYIDGLNVSFHYNEIIKHKKNEIFYKNIEYLNKNNIILHNLDIMLDYVKLNHLSDFYNKIEELMNSLQYRHSEMIYGFWHYGEENNTKSLNQHINFHNTHNSNDQVLEIDNISYTTNQMFKEGIDFSGWRCSSGSAFLYINGDGNVFSCGAHMTNFIRKEKEEISYTNLVTDKFAIQKLKHLRRYGTVCRWKYCGGDYIRNRKLEEIK